VATNRKIVLIYCWGIGLLAAAYISLGLVTLVFETNLSYPVDLRLRWIEQVSIAQGLNPQAMTYPEELLPEMILGQRNVRGNYPPWSYAMGMLLVPPVNWNLVRVYFALTNMGALCIVGWWSYRRGEEAAKGWGPVAAVSVLAAFAICVCLSYGQYSIIAVALLMGCFELLRREHMASAGLLLGLAAVKPQLAGLFFLVPAIYPYPIAKKIRFFASAGGYLALSSFVIAWLVGGTPWEMFQGTTTEAVKFYLLSSNRLIIWATDAFGFSVGSKLLAATVAGICALLLFAVRRQKDLMVGFSICAILSLYWSYSRHYDLLILAFPLLELLRLWRARPSTLLAAAFLLLGILLWSPIRIEMSRWPSVQFANAVVCLIALATIIVLSHRSGIRRQTSSLEDGRKVHTPKATGHASIGMLGVER
jgi:hypothetical protein